MRNVLIAMLIMPLFLAQAAQAQTAPQGDPQKGRAMFSGQGGGAYCMLCHGFNAQGGFGPELAGGRGLTFEQFKKAVHDPWGIMPSFKHITDDGLANIYAFLKTLKPVAEPAPWSVLPSPEGAPRGQVLAVSLGCGQCHGPELGHPRRDIGGKGIDYEHFKEIVWDGKAPAVMGRFRRDRFPEPIVKEIWDFMTAEGFRALVFGKIERGETTGDNTTYTITVDNQGVPGKGINVDDVMLNVIVPKGLTVAKTTGNFQGVKKDAEYYPTPGRLSPFNNPKADLTKVKGDIAVWKVGKLPTGQKHSVTLMLSGAGAETANFTGTFFTWTKPNMKRLASVQQRDNRIPDTGDAIYGPSLEMSLPPMPKPAAPAPARSNN